MAKRSARTHAAARPVRGHVGVYAGSFDPVTFGHLDVIRRGRSLFHRLVVGVGQNPGKDTLFSSEERVEMLRSLIDDLLAKDPPDDDLATLEVSAFDGLTVDFARAAGAHVLLRGIRNLSDLQNEVQQALTNRQVAGLETVFIVAGQDFAYTSSSLIRQLTAMGRDLSPLRAMVPPNVVKMLQRKKRDGHPALARLIDRQDPAREG